MKNENVKCPKCGQRYYGAPALSRDDNATKICPDCGIREALTIAGFHDDKIEAVMTQIRLQKEQDR